MKINGRIFLLLLLIGLTVRVRAQQFGGIPPYLQWKQINNDRARILFPAGLENQAAQTASLIDSLASNTQPTIGSRLRKIDIIFQNRTTVSNGFVQLAPFRSEFQLTADQNSFELGSLSWPGQLAIHEYRHVQQYNNFRVGLSKALYYLFGQSGQELANSIAIPNWFWEGDAVFQETLVSRQGRGRIPFFFNGYRSLWSAGKNYSWMKLRNGSLRDFVPDHYPLGYMLVAYGREKYGEFFWKQSIQEAAAFRGFFYPLQKSISRHAKIDFTQFRREALDYYQKRFNSDLKPDSSGKPAGRSRHFIADEEFPQFVDPTHIVYVRTSYQRPHQFMIRDLLTGRDSSLGQRAVSLDNYFSCRHQKIVYSAYEPDLRWGWTDYGVIRVLDIKTGKQTRLGSHTKYFSPDISGDGLHIIAVNLAEDGNSSLVLLNSITGGIERKIPNKDHLYYTYPKFLNADQVVSAIRNPDGRMAIALINIQDGSASYLSDFSLNPIGFPAVRGDTILFSATHESRDEVMAIIQGRIYKALLPEGPASLGNYQAQALDNRFTFTRFTAEGYQMVVMDRAAIQWQAAAVAEAPLQFLQLKALNQGPADLLDRVPSQTHPISNYPGGSHLLNFHSWRPYIVDPNYTFSLESENVLNTLQTELYASYNRNEQSKKLGADAIFGGWFPWVNAGINYTFDRNAYYGNQRIYWNEWQAIAGISVPLNLSKGRWISQMHVGSNIVYDQPDFSEKYQSFKDSFNIRSFAYLDPYLTFTNQVQQARQQINPSWAQSVSVQFQRGFTHYDAWQFLASGYFYFPGIAPTNSLVISGAFQQRDSLTGVRFSNNFPFSRGYSSENFYRMFRCGLNYHVPLAYPDWGFGNMIYFLRIRANLFYDYTEAMDFDTNGNPYRNHYRSYGTELYFDTKWWNQLPISIGIRYSRLIDPDTQGRGPNQWEFVLPVTLLGK